MVFSDTSTQDGMVQRFEFWTRLPYGSSGDLLKTITARINAGFDSIMPLLLSYSDHIRWDDINHGDRPIGTVDIVSGQADYTVEHDDNTLDILNLTRVRILESASGTEYKELERMFIDDERALDALSPNPSIGGIPTHYLEQGVNIFLYPEPNYAATNGLELFFEREQSYFVSTDTTKEIKIPKPFHELVVLYGALDYVGVNRPDDTALLNRIERKIAEMSQNLNDMISMRNPVKPRFTVKGDNK